MAPSITGYTGTWTHGGSVTITGNNFGSKATAAPTVWDNCQGTDMSVLWDGWYPNETYHTFDTDIMQYSSPIRGVAAPHSHATKYMRGCGDMGTAGDVMCWKAYTRPSWPYRVYASFYTRFDPSWVFYGSLTDNQKWANHCAGIIPYQNGLVDGSIYKEYYNQQWTWPTPFQSAGDTGAEWGMQTTNDLSFYGEPISIPGEDVFSRWVKIEMESTYSNSASVGVSRAWANGRLVIEKSFENDIWNNTTNRCDAVGGYARPYSDDDTQWRYFCDIYYDRSSSRVILGNENIYANCTIREPQIPTAWASGSITVTVNQGALGATAYPYVVDANGDVSAAGTQITFGEAEPDPPIGTPVLSVR